MEKSTLEQPNALLQAAYGGKVLTLLRNVLVPSDGIRTQIGGIGACSSNPEKD